jgi:hypothetical protein
MCADACSRHDKHALGEQSTPAIHRLDEEIPTAALYLKPSAVALSGITDSVSPERLGHRSSCEFGMMAILIPATVQVKKNPGLNWTANHRRKARHALSADFTRRFSLSFLRGCLGDWRYNPASGRASSKDKSGAAPREAKGTTIKQ